VKVAMIVLDRIEPGITPDYCIHGRASCVAPGCTEWVWLGHQTFEVVNSGRALPVCRECAGNLLRNSPDAHLEGHVGDHPRSAGPHP
jgi:hypothetical protein